MSIRLLTVFVNWINANSISSHSIVFNYQIVIETLGVHCLSLQLNCHLLPDRNSMLHMLYVFVFLPVPDTVLIQIVGISLDS